MKIERIIYGVLTILLFTVFTACIDRHKYDPKPYVRALEIVKFSDSDYMHVSYLKDKNGGYTPCNGYIFIDHKEALIFDTAINDSLSDQLIAYVQNVLKSTIKGVVNNHSHSDASGGLKAFQAKNIPSYASQKTANILAKDSLFISNPFILKQEITIGMEKVENSYFGEAHTSGNIVSYIPSSQTIVGGCMVKEINGVKGNLNDANLDAWSQTIENVQNAYPEIKRVIPGHGIYGDSTLPDYTSSLFALEQESALNLE